MRPSDDYYIRLTLGLIATKRSYSLTTTVSHHNTYMAKITFSLNSQSGCFRKIARLSLEMPSAGPPSESSRIVAQTASDIGEWVCRVFAMDVCQKAPSPYFGRRGQIPSNIKSQIITNLISTSISLKITSPVLRNIAPLKCLPLRCPRHHPQPFPWAPWKAWRPRGAPNEHARYPIPEIWPSS